jgi:hypothetical protein
MLSKDDIFKADDLPRETVAVPEWGGDVCVRTMSSEEKDQWEADWLNWKKNVNGDEEDTAYFNAFIAAYTCAGENGAPLFSKSDIKPLAKKSAKALGRIAAVAARLNFIRDEEIEALRKNSATGQSVASG